MVVATLPTKARRKSAVVRKTYADTIADILRTMPPDDAALFHNVSWELYDRLCHIRDAERSGVHLTFDCGRLEIMAVQYPHESGKVRTSRIVEAFCIAFRIPIRGTGNLTVRNEVIEKGFESDSCYYIKNVSKALQIRELDFSKDPPPDLAIEVESSRKLIDRIPLYAAMGVPEIWRVTGTKIEFLLLISKKKGYESASNSPTFPKVPLAQIERFLVRSEKIDETTLTTEILDWVAKEVKS